jgi:hypothetical protein
MNFSYLSGKWSITKQVEVLTDNSGNVIETETMTQEEDMFTIEFLSPTSARIIMVEDGMWANATWSVNEADSMMQLAFTIDDEAIDVQLKIKSLTATDATLYEEDTEEIDGQPATFENTITFKKNGDNIPNLSTEMIEGKWSVNSQVIEGLVDENDDGKFDENNEVMFTMDMSEIPFNRLTREFMSNGRILEIDTYLESNYNTHSEWNMLDGSNIVITEDEMSFLVHITSVNGDLINAMFIRYDEENDGQGNLIPIKYIGELTMSLNNGDEPSFSDADLAANWELMEVKDYKNGVLNPESDAPVGAILSFVNDGSGTMSLGQESIVLEWDMVDKSNFTLAGQFDGPNEEVQTMLFNILSFDETTGIMDLAMGHHEMDNGTSLYIESKVKLKLVQ